MFRIWSLIIKVQALNCRFEFWICESRSDAYLVGKCLALPENGPCESSKKTYLLQLMAQNVLEGRLEA